MPISYFDPDFDKRLKSHIDPSRTVLMKEPYRSEIVNPHLYHASEKNTDESLRRERGNTIWRIVMDYAVCSVAEGCNIINKAFKKENYGKCLPIPKERQFMILTNREMPDDMRFNKTEDLLSHNIGLPPFTDEEGRVTKYFSLLIDRIHEVALEEKESARKLGRSEGFEAGITIANKWIQNHNIDVNEEVKNYEFKDYSEKYDPTQGTGFFKYDKTKEELLTILEKYWEREDRK